ncbi:CidA/LrgA family protein [Caviibacter abscessus]|uniref:CidA/LrgA family protein n=1 Tax=Caviibacter abscessus TaxID=1766719 RepID=UPI000834A74C|nr:CidA/LrgA family protein [Caviibacter abscessus]
MEFYKELMYILIFSFLGEGLSPFIPLPIPGSVIGMFLLFIALETKIVNLKKIENVGSFLIANLGILFVPAGVGIMTKFGLIKEIWISFFVLTIVTTIISLIIIAKTVEIIKKYFEKGKDNKDVK